METKNALSSVTPLTSVIHDPIPSVVGVAKIHIAGHNNGNLLYQVSDPMILSNEDFVSGLCNGPQPCFDLLGNCSESLNSKPVPISPVVVPVAQNSLVPRIDVQQCPLSHVSALVSCSDNSIAVSTPVVVVSNSPSAAAVSLPKKFVVSAPPVIGRSRFHRVMYLLYLCMLCNRYSHTPN